ncbi:hypothetical protein [Micromonospora sp. DT229]|uniref:hypothetical protein n=1 Tax=Micromonospora sp. DT229 TaxID=3393430 RepID=UPI003CF6A1D0
MAFQARSAAHQGSSLRVASNAMAVDQPDVDASDGFPAVMELARRADRDDDPVALARAVHRLTALTDLDTASANRAAELGFMLFLLSERTGDPEPLSAAQQAYRAALTCGDEAAARSITVW